MKKGTVEHRSLRGVIGANMKRARNDAGLTLEVMADRLSNSQFAPVRYVDGSRSLSAATYKQWELGRNPVHLDWVPALCDVLDCDPGFLFGEYPERRHRTADICSATGLSEKAASNWGAYDYHYSVGGKKVPFLDQSGLAPSEVLSRLLESDAFWRVLGNISWWTKTGVLKMSKLADEHNPTACGLPTVPGYIEPNSAIVPFEEKTRDLYMAAATKRFGDAVEEIFADLLEQESRSLSLVKETAETSDEEATAVSEPPVFYDRQSPDRLELYEGLHSDTEALVRTMNAEK